ncbi:MAG: FTR1 family protein [Pseudomonadota bacterium]
MIARLVAAAALLLLAALPAHAQGVDLKAVADELAAKGDALVTAYAPSDGAATADAFSDLYFDVFEASGMEQAVGAASPSEKTRLEALFGQIIGKAGAGAPRPEVAAPWAELRAGLLTAGQPKEETTGAVGAFVQSFLILLREGFEAMLVVTALVATLRRSGQHAKTRVVWQGTLWALAASLLAAWLLDRVFTVSGQDQEVLEGVVMLTAAAVLFYVSFWLLSKRETATWQAYVKAQVDAAASAGRTWALGLAAFLAVFREGAETVLFYQALAVSSPGQTPAIAAGFAAAAAALGALYVAMRVLSLRLPLGLFFSGTAALLFVLAVSFAGKGILELQEGRLLSITPVDGLPSLAWLGVFPTVEGLAAQALLVVPMMAAVAWLRARKRRATA